MAHDTPSPALLARPAVIRSLNLLSLIFLGPAITSGCGDNNGGTSTSATESGTTEGESETQPTTGGNDPPVHLEGDACGPIPLGYQTRCIQDDAFIRFGASSNEDDAETLPGLVGVGANSEFSPVCCEGLASEATADEACADRCQRLVCEAARSNHRDLAEGIEGFHICPSTDCGFDMGACLTGKWHKQRIKFVIYYWDYWLRAQCEDARTNQTFTNDVFDWNQHPDDDSKDNPVMCEGTEDAERDPGNAFSDHIAAESAGTTAMVTWTIAGSTAVEDTQALALRFAYDLHDCATHARCLDLAELQLRLPTLTVQGLLLENAHLTIYRVDTQPVLQSSGAFSYGPGTLHAIVSATAAGVPIVLKGANSGTAQGQLSPGSDALTLSGLKFDYSDSVITAQLQVDLVGDYVERGPTAVIVPVDVPRACADPVSFRAASSDPDAQTLSHVWWVPGASVSAGATLDIVLPKGTHPIALLSKDPDGNLDATAIQYTRVCL